MMRSMYAAISGLRVHQTMLDITANNIANVLTPGFRSSSVSFESALSAALGRGEVPDTSRITTFDQGEAPNSQGNTVSLETEMTQNVKDSLTFESMINSFNYKVSVLRQAIGGKP